MCMKKFLFAMALGALLVLALATTVTADNGPHGGFNGSTDACASCHRAHSAVSSDGFLLVAGDIYSLCTSCHDGTGAYTNVVDGYYDDGTCGRVAPDDPGKAAWPGGQGDACGSLFAGGFVNARMLTDYGNAGNEGGLANDTTNAAADQNASATSWARWNAYDTLSTAPASRAVTSNHDVSTVGRSGTVWGSGNFNPAGTGPTWGAGTFTGATELECTSCHDPHGNAGRQGGLSAGAPYPSYRLLRFTPSGSNGYEAGTVGSGTGFTWNTAVVPDIAGVLVPDTSAQYWYTINNDYNLDGMLLAYRGRVNSGDMWTANFAGQGDYMGRYYGYQRPAGSVTGATSGTVLSCVDGTGVPTIPGTACPATTGTAFNNVAAQDKLGFWCATCHDRYLAQGGSATRSTDSGDAGYHYRHRSQGNSTSSGQYTCVSCHNAHGTAATASSAVAFNASYATGSVLLKADNRAICIRCHAGAVNFFNVTTSPGAVMTLPVFP
ncbi:MAG: cytochrome c3 family protein [Chloroflexota bacterium]